MEDLRTHQRMECGRGDYRDDDNLSISGDEDVSTLNDMAGIVSPEFTLIHSSVRPRFTLPLFTVSLEIPGLLPFPHVAR